MINCVLKALQIGVIAGMRTMAAPALVSYKLSHMETDPLPDSKFNFLTSRTTAKILARMAGGELIVDKLPRTSSRLKQPQIWGRIASGAFAAAVLTEADGNSASAGAALGALGAVAGAFAFYHLRHWLTQEKGLPDVGVALAEDALAVSVGWAIVHQD